MKAVRFWVGMEPLVLGLLIGSGIKWISLGDYTNGIFCLAAGLPTLVAYFWPLSKDEGRP